MVARTEQGSSVQLQLKEWRRFYKEVWGIRMNLSELLLPAQRKSFNWLVVMLKGMTARRIVNEMQKQMKVWVYEEDQYEEDQLDRVKSNRKSDHDYAIWLRDRVEADEELKDLSANDLKARGVNSITLPERLMLEFFYWRETKKHLDISNVTLCGGSRGGSSRRHVSRVPMVRWRSGGGVCVGWCYPAHRYPFLRARQAVSA